MKIKRIIFGASLALATVALGEGLKAEENFPADYFMTHKNLPHYMKIFTMYGENKELALTPSQKEAIGKIKEQVMRAVPKKASEIKELELSLQKKVIFENKTSGDVKELTDKIAELRKELTNTHIDCISKVKAILDKRQNEFFINKAGIEK